MTLPLEREALLPRIDGIRKNIAKLNELGKLPVEQFRTGDPFDLAQHHLRLALEGVFHIGTHILSRLPGGRTVEYSDIAKKLGDFKIVERDFADTHLVPMAKMRNLLVHQYAQITPERLYHIIHENISDIEHFLRAVKHVIEQPETFGLTLE